MVHGWMLVCGFRNSGSKLTENFPSQATLPTHFFRNLASDACQHRATSIRSAGLVRRIGTDLRILVLGAGSVLGLTQAAFCWVLGIVHAVMHCRHGSQIGKNGE
jgi:hypothetical protein